MIVINTSRINWDNPVNQSSPLNRGLVRWWLGRAGLASPSVFDLTKRNNMAFVGAPIWTTDYRNNNLRSLSVTAANYGAVTGTVGTDLQLNWPISISVWLYRRAGTITNSAYYAGLLHNSTNASPFMVCALYHSTSVGVRVGINSAGTFVSTDTGAFTTQDAWENWCVVQESSALNVYRNGVSIYSNSTARSNPTYGATPVVLLGDGTLTSRNINHYLQDHRIWNRALSADEVYQVYTDSLTGYQKTLNRISQIIPYTNNIISSPSSVFRRKNVFYSNSLYSRTLESILNYRY